MLHKTYCILGCWVVVFVVFAKASSVAIAQEYVCVNGNLLDEETKKPLSLATVTLAVSPLGVVTGEKGEFVFYVSSKVVHDTLVIRMPGYEELRLPVKEAQARKEFLLKPKSIPIEEVAVVAITAKKILNSAFKNVKKNYPDKPFLLSCDFQEYICEGDRYVRALEASSSLYDKSSFSWSDELLEIDSVSLSANRIAEKHLPLLFKDQIMSAYVRFGILLNYGKVYNDAAYSVEQVFWDGNDKVYEVVCKGKTYREVYRINASDYAIIFWEYQQIVPSINDSETKDVWRDYLKYYNTISFRKVDGYYYPLIITCNLTLRQHKGKDNPVALYTHTNISQLLVTKVETNVSKRIANKKRKLEDAYYTKAPRRETWRHYNSLPNSDVRQAALRQLELVY